MIETPFFSIITVCFNSEKTIQRTINSIINQEYTNYEYIVIDGLSTDKTVKIINENKRAFGDKIQVISEKDNGIYNAMNKGIEIARGKYIGLLNSDDWFEPNALRSMYNAINENDFRENALYCGWLYFHYKTGRKQLLKTSLNLLIKKSSSFQMGGIRHPAVFVPKFVYSKTGLFDENLMIYADTEFVLRCYFNKVKFIFVNEIITNMSDGGVSSFLRFESLHDRLYILRKYSNSVWFIYSRLISFLIIQLFKSLLPSKLLRYLREKI